MPYTVKKNGKTVAIIDADSFKLDKSGDDVVLIFVKDGKEGELVEENNGAGTPYINWET